MNFFENLHYHIVNHFGKMSENFYVFHLVVVELFEQYPIICQDIKSGNRIIILLYLHQNRHIQNVNKQILTYPSPNRKISKRIY